MYTDAKVYEQNYNVGFFSILMTIRKQTLCHCFVMRVFNLKLDQLHFQKYLLMVIKW